MDRPAKAANEKVRKLPAQLRAEQLQLEVLGPARVASGAPNQYRLTTRNLNGTPADAVVTARIVAESRRDRADRRVLAQVRFGARGEKTFSLPSNWTGKEPQDSHLEGEARR